MDALVGAVLVAGFVVFMVGAVRWRLAYERPLAEVLRVVAVDRRRRAWIHVWMLLAMFITPAGVAAFAASTGRLEAVLAATVYALGAVCWIVSLTFRLTVVPWAAERTVADGHPPEGFAALDAWAGALYTLHMAASYTAYALLGAAVLGDGDLPRWLGWVGVIGGAGFLAGFVATRFAGPFNPPFWAHLYTGILGLLLLTS